MSTNPLFLVLLISAISFFKLSAQSSYIPVSNKDYYHLIDRFEIKSQESIPPLHLSAKPISRQTIGSLTDSLSNDSSLSPKDKFNLAYIQNDNNEWALAPNSRSNKPILKYFYTQKSDFFSHSDSVFDLHINPVLYFSAGAITSPSQRTFINTRGLELRGSVNRKVGFYAFLTDNQAIFPQYVYDYPGFSNTFGIGAPGEGYTKRFKKNGVDFITARGYITFSLTKNIQAQFGHDKNFIGNGYRSLILSDFSSNYTFLKINTKVWKLNYQNIFAELTADVFYLNKLLPKKYLAFHHLSYNVTKNLNIGIFESVIIGRRDSIGGSRFDVGYLNPIIFYRSIEQQNGSEDNAMLGMDFKYKFLKHFSLYGQIVLDEFLLSHIKARDGWWGNKQALQLGLKYIDVVGIKNLDLQLEGNIVRPFTYSHKDNYTAYTHFNQALAHPLGANFYEAIGILRFQPLNRLNLTGKIIYAKIGMPDSTENTGTNIFLSYNTRPKNKELGYDLAGPNSYNLTIVSATASYMLKHNLFIDAVLLTRSMESKKMSNSMVQYSLALRWNIPQRIHEF
ncbi:MAG TPA: hypothetical protein VF691_08225 [Cytophagaceae bacterium]|jgi:hypothetical protein